MPVPVFDSYVPGETSDAWKTRLIPRRSRMSAVAVIMSLVILCSVTLTVWAQQPVVVDWTTRQLGAHPAVVDRATNVEIQVQNVDDIHFTYSIQLVGTPRTHFDFSEIEKAFQIAGGSALEANACDAGLINSVKKATQDLIDAGNAFMKLPETVASGCSESKPCDVTLLEARSHWASDVDPKLKVARDKYDDFRTLCKSSTYKDAGDALQTEMTKASNLAAQLDSPDHVARKQDTLLPDQDYVLSITQLYLGRPTQSGTATLQLLPANNRLTLSAGALFSEVQNRSYSSVAAPSSSGTGTQNVLAVGGVSKFSPTAIALLNYQIPHADWDTFGFALSSGPVFRLGSKSDTSSFGYFLGVSLHLFHRFFVTPGEHLGEFADFPPGFTQAGQVVPSGLQTPTPVKRWTWRFGISLSYKAKDFSSFGINGKVSPGSATSGTDSKTSTDKGSSGTGGTSSKSSSPHTSGT